MSQSLILNGVPWFDDEDHAVNAHGACIVEDAGAYYLFGEYKTDDENRFAGFSCYSSPDLAHWHFERLALPPQPDGPLGPNRIGERVKVMRCPATGRYVMYAHADDLGYRDPLIVVAVSDTVDGEYRMVGPLHHHDEPVRRWDMGTFQDADGTGYLMTHEGDIYRLSDDYLSAEELVASGIAPGGESPAMTRIGDTYITMFSNKTSWDRNDNYYLSAPSPDGPWTYRGLFAPQGSCTWNSQCSFIFPLTLADGRTVPMYMGDRWSFPHQVSCASQMWMPLRHDAVDDSISLPDYWPAWNPRTGECEDLPVGREMAVELDSSVPGEEIRLPFFCGAHERLAVIGTTDVDGGYAMLTIARPDGTMAFSSLIDCYSPTPYTGMVFVCPELPAGDYELRLRVTGEASMFYKKDGTRLGSTGTRVRTTAIRLI